jgi:hypothetical protein
MSTYTIDKNPTLPTTYYIAGKDKRFTKGRLLQAADVLDDAAKLLRLDNWTTGDWCDENGRMCAQGAIAKAAVGDPNAYGREAARAAIALADSVVIGKDREFGDYSVSILDFNDDAPPRYFEGNERKKHLAKIRKALRTAAKAARAKADTLKR